jgi:hypothetical protein
MTTGPPIDLGIEGLTDAEHIGSGGAADVYRADQTRLGRTVAVKILRATTTEKSQQQFEREAQTLGRLSSHPGIVTLLEAGVTAHGRPFLLMEFCPNGTLAELGRRTNGIHWSDSCRIVGEIEPVADLRPLGVPEDVAALLERAMAKNPGDRPAVSELADALTALAASSSPNQVPVDPRQPGIDPATASIANVLPQKPTSRPITHEGPAASDGNPPNSAAGPTTAEVSTLLPSLPTTLDRPDDANGFGKNRLALTGALTVVVIALVAGGLFVRSLVGSDKPAIEVAGTAMSAPAASATIATTTTTQPTTSQATTTAAPLLIVNATMQIASDGLELRGTVADRATAQSILEVARQTHAADQIDDQLDIDSTASSVVLTISGELSTFEAQLELIEALEAIDGLEVVDEISVVTTTTAAPRPATTRRRTPTTKAPATAAPATAAPPTAAPVTSPPTTAAPPATATETSSVLG